MAMTASRAIVMRFLRSSQKHRRCAAWFSCTTSRFHGATRIHKVMEALENLARHSYADANLMESDDVEHKTYRMLSWHKQAIRETLEKQHVLTESDESTANTIEAIHVMHANVGLGLRGISRLIERCPDIYCVKPSEIEKRIKNLRTLKLQGTVLQKTISNTPTLLLMSDSDLNTTAKFLVNCLDFTMAELPQLFLTSSRVLLDPHEATEEKFQYIFFSMGYKKQDMLVKHGVMQHGLDHIRTRHLFLERRGQYQRPDKFGNTTIKNPKIKPMLCSSSAYFCKEVALCKLDEFLLFKKVLMAEDRIRKEEEEDGEADQCNSTQLADQLFQEMS